MAWDYIIATIRAANVANPADSSQYVDVALDVMLPGWSDVQDDIGAREPGAGAIMLQNLATRGRGDFLVRRFSVDAGEWDYGDYQTCTKYFRAKHLWLQSVTGTGSDVQTADDAGSDVSLWGLILPRKVVITYDAPEYQTRKGAAATMNWAIQIMDVAPTIGVVI